MLFDSYEYYLFLPIVFLLYWSLRSSYKYQNILILLSSYFFYGWWDWRFLSLIFVNSILDYYVSLRIQESDSINIKKVWLYLSLGFNLGMLALFKYFDFFSESLADLLNLLGLGVEPVLLHFILPIGISFYTFQTLSYSIDVYKERIKPTRDLIQFLSYVSFFPQLVAGPIERASNILPQFDRPRVFDRAKAGDGMRQILWGLFKKVVIADNCAIYVDYIYENHLELPGPILAIGVILFVYQVYCDFSGYSDIAIGTARLFGIDLMQNFDFPFFAKNMTEFYRKWHISLSTWIRDYLFTPLSLNLRWMNKKYRYIIVFLITFTFFGFWHGANWTFIVFGLFQGMILSYEHASRKWRKKMASSAVQSAYSFASIILTFGFWSFSCLIFRARNLTHAWEIFIGIFRNGLSFSLDLVKAEGGIPLIYLFIGIATFMVIEFLQRQKQHGLSITSTPMPLRWSCYIVLLLIVTNFGIVEEIPFIYFQF